MRRHERNSRFTFTHRVAEDRAADESHDDHVHALELVRRHDVAVADRRHRDAREVERHRVGYEVVAGILVVHRQPVAVRVELDEKVEAAPRQVRREDDYERELDLGGEIDQGSQNFIFMKNEKIASGRRVPLYQDRALDFVLRDSVEWRTIGRE